MPKSRALFDKSPVFRNFIAASTVSLLGTHVFDWSIPVYVSIRTHSASSIALATIALHLPFLLMAPFTGFVVDNFNKRKVMLASDIGQVLCMIFLLCHDTWGGDSLWPLLVAVFVAKTLMITFETVATFQLIPSLVNKTELSEANTWFLSSQRLIQIIGPLLAGALMTAFGFRACIFVNLLSFAATLFFVISMKNLNELIYRRGDFSEGVPMTLKNVVENFKEGVKYIFRSPLFRPFVMMMFVWNFSSLVPGTPTIIHYFMHEQNFSPVQYGLITSLIGVFGIIGFLVAGAIYRLHRFTASFFGSSLWLSVFSSLSLFLMKMPLALSALFALSKAGASVLSMGTFVLRQTNIPFRQMGTVNALLRMFFMSSAPLSSALQGILLPHIGTGWCLSTGALCLWGTSFFAWKVAKEFRTEEDLVVDEKAA